jgi:hypothetical protein
MLLAPPELRDGIAAKPCYVSDTQAYLVPRTISASYVQHGSAEFQAWQQNKIRLEPRTRLRADCQHPYPRRTNMDVVKTLKPGKNGTKRLVEIYGDDLVAVRYRLDSERQLSYTTVELIIERKPAPDKGINRTAQRIYQNRQTVGLRILRHETDLQRLVKSLGAKWQPARQVWLIRRGDAIKLGLSERIIEP